MPVEATDNGSRQGDGSRAAAVHTNASMPSSPMTSVPIPRQRDPPIFSGTSSQDVEDWLDTHHRVSTYNRWDDATNLTNVVFYLDDLAKTWFENHESELRSWPTFRSRICELFGRPTMRKTDVLRKLSLRSQQPGESYVAYIEDVLALCNRGDPNMPEEDEEGDGDDDVSSSQIPPGGDGATLATGKVGKDGVT